MQELKIYADFMMIGIMSLTAEQQKALKKEGLSFDSSDPTSWCAEDADWHEEGFTSQIHVLVDDKEVLTISPPYQPSDTNPSIKDVIVCENPTSHALYVCKIANKFNPDKLKVSWEEFKFGLDLIYLLGKVSYDENELEYYEGGGGFCSSYYINHDGVIQEIGTTHDEENDVMIMKI